MCIVYSFQISAAVWVRAAAINLLMANKPSHTDQLPFVFEGPPDPRPRPEKRKAIAVSRKPVQREASVAHPTPQLVS